MQSHWNFSCAAFLSKGERVFLWLQKLFGTSWSLKYSARTATAHLFLFHTHTAIQLNSFREDLLQLGEGAGEEKERGLIWKWFASLEVKSIIKNTMLQPLADCQIHGDLWIFYVLPGHHQRQHNGAKGFFGGVVFLSIWSISFQCFLLYLSSHNGLGVLREHNRGSPSPLISWSP